MEIVWRATPTFAIIPPKPRKKPHVGGPVNPNLEEDRGAQAGSGSGDIDQPPRNGERAGPHRRAGIRHRPSFRGRDDCFRGTYWQCSGHGKIGRPAGRRSSRAPCRSRPPACRRRAAPRALRRVDRSADFRWARHVYRGCAAPRGWRNPWWIRKPNGRTSVWKKLCGCSRNFWCLPARMPETRSTISTSLRTRPGWREPGSDARRKHRRRQRRHQSPRAAHGGCHRTTGSRASSRIVRFDRDAFDTIRDSVNSTATVIEEACACAR